MLFRVRVADTVLLDGSSFDNNISIRRTRTLRKLVARLAVKVVAAGVLRAGSVHLGRSIWCRAAEVEHTAEQWTQGTQTADNHTDTVFSVAPDDNITNTVYVVCGVVQVDGVLETNAS